MVRLARRGTSGMTSWIAADEPPERDVMGWERELGAFTAGGGDGVEGVDASSARVASGRSSPTAWAAGGATGVGLVPKTRMPTQTTAITAIIPKASGTSDRRGGDAESS